MFTKYHSNSLERSVSTHASSRFGPLRDVIDLIRAAGFA